jgi:hypothetical protein
MMTPHKHAEWIKLWAEGYSLEFNYGDDDHWHPVDSRHMFKEDAQYRVSLIDKLPRSTIEEFKSWTEGFFDCMSNAESFDSDYWTGFKNLYDINIYNATEDDDNPKIGQWNVHLMQGYPGCSGYQELVSLGVIWDNHFKIIETNYFVGVKDEL